MYPKLGDIQNIDGVDWVVTEVRVYEDRNGYPVHAFGMIEKSKLHDFHDVIKPLTRDDLLDFYEGGGESS